MGKKWTPVQKNQLPTPQVLARIYIRSEVELAAGCVLGVGYTIGDVYVNSIGTGV